MFHIHEWKGIIVFFLYKSGRSVKKLKCVICVIIWYYLVNCHVCAGWYLSFDMMLVELNIEHVSICFAGLVWSYYCFPVFLLVTSYSRFFCHNAFSWTDDAQLLLRILKEHEEIWLSFLSAAGQKSLIQC